MNDSTFNDSTKTQMEKESLKLIFWSLSLSLSISGEFMNYFRKVKKGCFSVFFRKKMKLDENVYIQKLMWVKCGREKRRLLWH